MTNFDTTSSERSIASNVAKPGVLARSLLFVIRTYQQLTASRVAPCRFYPSCSHYAYEAIEVHGAGRGVGLALRRLARCRPLGPHGIDLVPEPKETRSSH